MGSLTGVLYQGLVPVFADVEPDTLNMDPAAVRAAITPRTKAILEVHHAGLAADLNAILDIGREHGIRERACYSRSSPSTTHRNSPLAP